MADDAKLLDYLKRVTAELYQAREKLRELEGVSREPIAVVGMGCRFPGGVRSPQDLWHLVESGSETVAGFPADRGWEAADLYDPTGRQAGRRPAPSIRRGDPCGRPRRRRCGAAVWPNRPTVAA